MRLCLGRHTFESARKVIRGNVVHADDFDLVANFGEVLLHKIDFRRAHSPRESVINHHDMELELGNSPSNAVAVLEERVHDVGSEVSRDSGNLNNRTKISGERKFREEGCSPVQEEKTC